MEKCGNTRANPRGEGPEQDTGENVGQPLPTARDPRCLVAVTAAADRAKGASGPEEWLPPDPLYRCRYVADWIAVKARWQLSMDESERAAVKNILDACQ